MDMKVVLLTSLGMFIDCLLLFYYMSSYENLKSKKKLLGLLYMVFYLINCILGLLDSFFLLKIICNVLIIVLLMRFGYVIQNTYSAVRDSITFILLLGVSELLIIPVMFLLTNDFDAGVFSDSSKPHVWLISMAFSRIITICLISVCRKVQKQKNYKLKKDEVFILYLPLGISFLAFLIIAKFVLNINKLEKEDFCLPLSLITFALMVLTLIYMLFFERYIRYRDSEREIKMLRQRNQLQYDYYISQHETFENMRILYHDLKNHILTSQVSNEYFEETNRNLKEFEKYVDVGSSILDVLLWQKYNEANKKGIEIQLQIGKVDLGFIDDIDLCAIIGNILDNALEACSEIDRSHIPEIILQIAEIHNFILIKVENDCLGNTLKQSSKKNLFETTKNEIRMHGIGLKSIKKSAKKYDGNCEFECQSNKFVTEVLIPIPVTR